MDNISHSPIDHPIISMQRHFSNSSSEAHLMDQVKISQIGLKTLKQEPSIQPKKTKNEGFKISFLSDAELQKMTKGIKNLSQNIME